MYQGAIKTTSKSATSSDLAAHVQSARLSAGRAPSVCLARIPPASHASSG